MAYVKERIQFGKPIWKFQNTQFQLADMATKVTAAQLLVYRAAVAKKTQKTYSVEAAMAKLYAAEVAMEVTTKAVQLHGGAADDLEDDVHSTLLAVIACDGEGDALAVFKRAHNDKLARLCLFGDQRGFNDHLRHGGIQRDFFSDLIHCVCSFMLAFPISAHENAPVCPRRHNRRSSYRRQNDTLHYNSLQKGKQINFLRVCRDKLE